MNQSYQTQQDQKRIDDQKKAMPWKEYWHLYLCLIGTGILTAFAGIYMGLAPSATGDITFASTWDMIRRIFFALYYAGSFLLVAEGATLFAKDKLLQRDVVMVGLVVEDIPAQRRSMTAMLYVSVMAIVLTTVAAGYILASWLHALDQFVTIPLGAQTWVVIGPPALLVFDAVMALIYQQNSKKYELDRYVQQKKRMAEADAQVIWGDTYVQEYGKAAPEAARRAATVQANTDAKIWAGAGVDKPELSHSHDLHDSNVGMDIGSHDATAMTEIKDGKVVAVKVMEKPQYPVIIPSSTTDFSYEVSPEENTNGKHPVVMEENTMTTDQEAGETPDSPM